MNMKDNPYDDMLNEIHEERNRKIILVKNIEGDKVGINFSDFEAEFNSTESLKINDTITADFRNGEILFIKSIIDNKKAILKVFTNDSHEYVNPKYCIAGTEFIIR